MASTQECREKSSDQTSSDQSQSTKPAIRQAPAAHLSSLTSDKTYTSEPYISDSSDPQNPSDLLLNVVPELLVLPEPVLPEPVLPEPGLPEPQVTPKPSRSRRSSRAKKAKIPKAIDPPGRVIDLNSQASLYLADCRLVLAQLPTNSIDLIFADPPYNLSNDGFTCHGGQAVSVNKGDWDRSQGVERDFEFQESWLRECWRALKPSGTIWVSGTYHNIFACGFALQKIGFHLLNDICWYKPNASPNLSCRMFTASHETLLWARKSKRGKHKFNYDAMKNGDFGSDRLKEQGRQMRSVWSIPTPPASEKRHGKHPTQKPLALLDRIMQASAHAGDVVLDPFMGSGTTGVAALRHGCRFLGIESNPEYLQIAIARLESELDDYHKKPPQKAPDQPNEPPENG